MTSIYHQEKEKMLTILHNAAEDLYDLEFNLPPSYRLTRNERIKLQNIMWFVSNHQALYEKEDLENPPLQSHSFLHGLTPDSKALIKSFTITSSGFT